MDSILRLGLFVRSFINEDSCMKLLRKDEIKILREFLRIPIPEFIREYESGEFDLMD